MKVETQYIDPRIEQLAYATKGSAAVDLRASAIFDGESRIPLTSSYTMMPGAKVKIGTGVAIYIGSMDVHGEHVNADPNFTAAALLLPRSGKGWEGLELANTVGLIDSDYQGELILAAKNGGAEPISFVPLERLCQMLIVPVLRPDYPGVMVFSDWTQRNTGGFGSTGK